MSITKLFDLTGKTALVTGCKRGIGKAMAIALADAGADIILGDAGAFLALPDNGFGTKENSADFPMIR